MKNLLLIAILISSVFATAQTKNTTTEGVTITVTVDKVKNNKGKVLFALYTEDTFMKRQPLQAVGSKIEENKVTVTFTNVPKGEYAITCVHDENDNGQMDFEPSGMPKEDYGTSNNQLSYGPPEFGPSKFTVKDADIALKIVL
ncbi:DUF2141 domain-containing protein [Kordia sp. YSTF-M3]|uniref:DUF2141 domain-containing protein n=1 Tax=Kordia aestuariivivens TaxID=2759037 RepID=A0ABR7Q629_9FLAO|nr:DUF2141 domain-containing protein [Kordia aestuariivivens]MBC8753799.1 DUF2141 domain-containing protein [Kordia aestuariivivens]